MGLAMDGLKYWLHIDTDGDPEPEHHQLSCWYGEDRWFVSLDDMTDGEEVDGGEATMAVVDGIITASVALDALPVAPSRMRFAASTKVFGGFDDTNNVFNWTPIDRVPDEGSAWVALGETVSPRPASDRVQLAEDMLDSERVSPDGAEE